MTVVVAILWSGCLLVDEEVDDTPPIDDLLSASERIELDGVDVSLETYMWRDFMPMSPPDGRALSAIFRVDSDQKVELPLGLQVVAAWVVYRNKVWRSDIGASQPRPFPYRIERFARNGPKWGPDVEVAAVVRLLEADGSTHLLRASGQVIHITQ